MPTILSTEHIIWITLFCREALTLPFTVFAITVDFLYETLSTLVFTAAAINPLFSETLFYTGFTLYVSSIVLELCAEIQRARFKSDLANAGKLCTTGFWGVSRHINYTANVLYGFGYGLATGRPLYSLATAGMYVGTFVSTAIPGIEKYCGEKYKVQWVKYEREVPWMLFPGIY